MIDKKSLETINHKIKQVENWLCLSEQINERLEFDNIGSVQRCVILKIHGTDTKLFFHPNDLKEIVKVKILELEKQLISLGYQPSPLNENKQEPSEEDD